MMKLRMDDSVTRHSVDGKGSKCCSRLHLNLIPSLSKSTISAQIGNPNEFLNIDQECLEVNMNQYMSRKLSSLLCRILKHKNPQKLRSTDEYICCGTPCSTCIYRKLHNISSCIWSIIGMLHRHFKSFILLLYVKNSIQFALFKQ